MLTSVELVEIYKDLHEHLFLRDYTYVDDYLKNIDIETADIMLLIGPCRLTCSWKDDLPYWETYFELAYNEVKRRGKDADKLFSGL